MIYLFLILSIYLLTRKKKSEYWNGPEPTLPQKQDNWQWLVDYFQEFPNSPLKIAYPTLFKVAMATKRYKELQVLRLSNQIDDIDYEIELQKILPLIDITGDLKGFANNFSKV